MQVLRVILLCGILASVIAGTVFADQENEVIALVDKAIASFKEKGTDYTMRLINSTRGPFMKGELYVLCMDFDGNMLGHAAHKELVGKNLTNFKDGKGGLIFPAQLEAAKTPEGKGWTEYWWLRHGEKEPTLKRTFIKRVPGQDIFVGCGYYVK